MRLRNLARMTTATKGTGTITLGSAVSGHNTFANAGVADGEKVRYAIIDGANSEVGEGTYTSSGTTLSRDTVTSSTNSGSKISLSGSAEVCITAAAEDFTRVLLATLTASSSATLSDTTHITSDFDDYEIVFENIVPATNLAQLQLQVHSGGSYQTTSYQAIVDDIDNLGNRGAAGGTTFIPITRGVVGNGSTDGFNGTLRIYKPSDTTHYKTMDGFGISKAPSTILIGHYGGTWAGGTGAVDGFQIQFSSGNIASGTVKIFGLR